MRVFHICSPEARETARPGGLPERDVGDGPRPRKAGGGKELLFHAARYRECLGRAGFEVVVISHLLRLRTEEAARPLYCLPATAPAATSVGELPGPVAGLAMNNI